MKSSKPNYRIGFDLGGTKMLAVVLDGQYQILAETKAPSNGNEGKEAGLKLMAKLMSEVLKQAGLEPEQLAGIGVGCPGVVDRTSGVLLDAPNLGWKETPMVDYFGKAFKCPVSLLNDVDAGTYGEYHMGAGRGHRSVFGVFPGTGLGAGFIYDGNLIQGKRLSCMEFGNMYVPGTSLGSARRGAVIWEDLTSRLTVSASAGVASWRGQSQVVQNKAGTDLRLIKSRTLAAALDDGEEKMKSILKDATYYLGMAVGGVVSLLAPDCVILGGGLVEALPDFYLKRVEKFTRAFAVSELCDDLEFKLAQLGTHAVAIGAAIYAAHAGGDRFALSRQAPAVSANATMSSISQV